MAKVIIDIEEYESLKQRAGRAPQERRYYPPEPGSYEWAVGRADGMGVYYDRENGRWDYHVDSEGQG